uniref:Secreted protein n=1 Tax=Acanthochromis polyacanthus TaxID=80966 RepID=A0A3Q1FIX2_9TELE
MCDCIIYLLLCLSLNIYEKCLPPTKRAHTHTHARALTHTHTHTPPFSKRLSRKREKKPRAKLPSGLPFAYWESDFLPQDCREIAYI